MVQIKIKVPKDRKIEIPMEFEVDSEIVISIEQPLTHKPNIITIDQSLSKAEKQKALTEAMEKAMKDPGFLEDLEEVMDDFKYVDAEFSDYK